VCCSVLQCVAVRCSGAMLAGTNIAIPRNHFKRLCVLQYVAVFCVAIYFSVLQCVAVLAGINIAIPRYDRKLLCVLLCVAGCCSDMQ